MKFSPKIIGLMEATGVTLYISFFAVMARWIQQWLMVYRVQPPPTLAIILFLLAFILSALICGLIVFAYPVFLFFEGRKVDSLKIIGWGITWLSGFFLIFGSASLIVWLRYF